MLSMASITPDLAQKDDRGAKAAQVAGDIAGRIAADIRAGRCDFRYYGRRLVVKPGSIVIARY